MQRNRGRNATVGTARSRRNGRKAHKGSHGMHTGQAPNEAAGRRARDLDSSDDDDSADVCIYAGTVTISAQGPEQRARDLDSGDDDDSADVCIYSGTAIIGAQGPDRALEASDRSGSNREFLQISRAQSYRSALGGEDTDSSDDSSGAVAGSNISDGSASPIVRRPDPYDGKADPLVFDEWKVKVETWAEANGLSKRQVMSYFPLLITGWAKRCFDLYIVPASPSRKYELKEVFEILYEQCCPLGCKLRVHRQLVSARQGSLTVLDFASRIKTLAKHVPYPVDEEFLVTIFYEGLNSPIKAKLIMLKCVPGGNADFEAMVRQARTFEEPVHRLL